MKRTIAPIVSPRNRTGTVSIEVKARRRMNDSWPGDSGPYLPNAAVAEVDVHIATESTGRRTEGLDMLRDGQPAPPRA